MEISESSLNALVASVDDQHRASRDSLGDDIRELHGETRRLRAFGGRRRFLRTAGAGGLAVAIGSQVLPLGMFVGRAGAADGDIAAFAESVELTAVAAYDAAVASGLVTTKAIADAAITFQGHHQEHAAAFGAAAGSGATGKLNSKLLAALQPSLAAAKTESDVVRIAFDLEGAAAATYLFALGALTSVPALQLTASILPVEAQHQTVLGSVLGLAASDYLPPFQTETGAVDPAKFPVG